LEPLTPAAKRNFRQAALATSFETPTQATRVLFTPHHRQTQLSLIEESDSEEQPSSSGLASQLQDLSLASDSEPEPQGKKKKPRRGGAKDVKAFFTVVEERDKERLW
jgi:hypothetical protein